MTLKNYHHQATLKDGRQALVRAIRPEDKDLLSQAFSRLSFDSAYARFFRVKTKLSDRDLKYLTEIDFINHIAIGVGLEKSDSLMPIGIGRYIVDEVDKHCAEVAITVDDKFQGLGVGSILFKNLCAIARERKIERFNATVLPSNNKMMRMFESVNLPIEKSIQDGVLEVMIFLSGGSKRGRS